MKKEFLLFVCLILLGIQAFPQKVVETNYYSENAELGGEVVIKKSTKEVVGSKTIVTFEVRNKAGHTTDISYSNAHEFDISLSKDAVSVDFTIDNASSVYLNLLDLYGNVAYSRLNGEKLQNGEYSLKLPIGKEDIYLVQLIINGRANVKKVVVNKH